MYRSCNTEALFQKNRLAPSVDNYVYHFFGANPLSETVPSSMVMVLVQYQLP